MFINNFVVAIPNRAQSPFVPLGTGGTIPYVGFVTIWTPIQTLAAVFIDNFLVHILISLRIHHPDKFGVDGKIQGFIRCGVEHPALKGDRGPIILHRGKGNVCLTFVFKDNNAVILYT